MKKHNRSIPLYGKNHHNKGSAQIAQQLTLFDLPQDPAAVLFKKRRKRQIATTLGVNLRNPWKYRVIVGNQVLGSHLTLDEALELAKGGAR